MTASRVGNACASVYTRVVSRMSLCRIMAMAIRAETPLFCRRVQNVCLKAWKSTLPPVPSLSAISARLKSAATVV